MPGMPGTAEPKADTAAPARGEDLNDLKSQMQALQRQLEQLTKAGQKAD